MDHVIPSLLVLLVTLTLTSGDPLHRMELTPDDHPLAICNDGTRAVYYHTANPPPSVSHPPAATPSHFVIFLQGGYFCESVEECERRCERETPYYCTAPRVDALTDSALQRQGILSDDPEVNPTFAEYYKVHLSYCTSDMHVGDRGACAETGGRHFRGWAVFTALINSLSAHAGLSHAAQVVLAGTSAGGRGAAFLCPRLRHLLPASVQLRCVVDAAIFYPQPFLPGCRPFNNLIATANHWWNGHIRDFNITTWWRDYPLPLFISIQSQDAYAHLYMCLDPANSEHLWRFGREMALLAEELTQVAPHVGLFMPSCNQHPLVTDPHFFNQITAGEAGLTLSQTLTNWLRGEGVSHVWDNCATAKHPVCNPNCEDPSAKKFVNYPLEELMPVEEEDKAKSTQSPKSEL